MNAHPVRLDKLDGTDALRYLGLRDGLKDPAMAALFAKCEARMLAAIAPRYVYRVFPYRDGQLVGSSYQPSGTSISRHLSGADRVLLMAATLGPGADLLIRRAQLFGMAEAMMLDALASEAIERSLDTAEAEIFARLGETRHTFRYSPGYGDLPLEGQRGLLDVLDARKRIGVYVNESLLMTPAKSVTCLIGLGEGISEEAKRTCKDCGLNGNCLFLRNQTTCYR